MRQLPLLALSITALAGCSGEETTDSTGSTTGTTTTTTPPPSAQVELVGHADLGARGMNAALAVANGFVYIGSRTDGELHADAGVMIVDATDPAAPQIVGQIGPPNEALAGMSSRELRAVPDKNLLIVLNFYCSPDIHECTLDLQDFPTTGGAAETDNLKFYDISQPAQPQLVATYDFGSYPGGSNAKPHEFFLWRDPVNADRILLYMTTPVGPPGLQVIDISDLANIQVVASWDAQADGGLTESRLSSLSHSFSVSDDGALGYMSQTRAGFFMVDTGDIAAGVAGPTVKVLTPMDRRIDYSPPEPEGTHSALPLPGRDVVLLTDEVYPVPVSAGCPWGWMRLVDVADPTQPAIVSELRMAENQPDYCPDTTGAPLETTFTAHNPTVTDNLAFITWHSAGLIVVDTTDPAAPAMLTAYKPEPLAQVNVEDPMFMGNPVAMWSYPVIKDGLIYVVDVRNGLYILRYTGPHEEQVQGATFLEGNSNLK